MCSNRVQSVPISDVPAQLVTDLYSFTLRCTLFIIDPSSLRGKPYRMGYRMVELNLKKQEGIYKVREIT
jgi:hypothetical protein